ncbi:type II asparaginase [Helicobacter sp. MIT 14-3879]|uniref:type II asparaginase n=1 Tax=Helicobacter sp. MIT 14-3879 TaxID=2040649 RepID=UPI000E1F16E0|nr:type II asparaginase [Helicobacter sp. MIT 14-3879]RDU65673.1 L-asparaginase [Helicobacter sp. MIT 14-3879]
MRNIIYGVLLMISLSVNALAKPHIVILATGGTIAGEAKSELATTGYKAGSIAIDTLINAVPEMKEIANISGEQIANIDSSNMSDEIWLKLYGRLSELMEDSSVDGVVITHGTDTMEESAYFLSLVLDAKKPIVLTGAMRPASAMSADGAKNLYNALALAASKEARSRGVMVAINDRIFSPRDVTKTHTLNIDTFKSPNSGEIGYIIDGKAVFNTLSQVSPKAAFKKAAFNIKGLKSLPKVDIVYTYSNDGSKVAIEAFLGAGSKGIIVAGSGAGSIHQNQKDYLIQLLKDKKLVVVKSSRVGSGIVPLSSEEVAQGFISANNLNPQKARVLLMLSLTKTKDIKEIQKYFNMY